MSKVYIFNPETDFALAHNGRFYTPNKRISSMRDRLSLLPALLADENDFIIIPDLPDEKIDSLPLRKFAEIKNLHLWCRKDVSAFFKNRVSISQVIPWGWNPEIRTRLNNWGIADYLLPSEAEICQWRDLAHRKISTVFFEDYGNLFPQSPSPVVLQTIEETEAFIDSNKDVCLKAPWSSSGRGVAFSHAMSKPAMMEWSSGILRSQRGLIGEKAYNRKLDFASEWIIQNGNAIFKGISIFKSSPRGKYKGNFLINESDALSLLRANSKNWSENILEIQKNFIENRISHTYSGPAGIDMLIDVDGTVNPFVEINLRNTMGHLAVRLQKDLTTESPEIINEIKRIAPNDFFSPADL